MRPVFADTFYWIALLNRRDAWYERVVTVSRTLGTRRLITTEWVLAEFLAFYSAAGEVTRQRAASRVRQLLGDPNVQVFSASQATFLAGLGLYESRPDKAYSLDRLCLYARRCVAMGRYGGTDQRPPFHRAP